MLIAYKEKCESSYSNHYEYAESNVQKWVKHYRAQGYVVKTFTTIENLYTYNKEHRK